MKKVKITVTKKNIEDARKSQKRSGYVVTRTCPVARAVRTAMKNNPWEVGVFSTWLHRKGKSTIMTDLPLIAQNFISSFDREQPVKPFSFFVTLPA